MALVQVNYLTRSYLLLESFVQSFVASNGKVFNATFRSMHQLQNVIDYLR